MHIRRLRRRWSAFAAPRGLWFSVRWYALQLLVSVWWVLCTGVQEWLWSPVTWWPFSPTAPSSLVPPYLFAASLAIGTLSVFVHSLVLRAAHYRFLWDRGLQGRPNPWRSGRRLLSAALGGSWIVAATGVVQVAWSFGRAGRPSEAFEWMIVLCQLLLATLLLMSLTFREALRHLRPRIPPPAIAMAFTPHAAHNVIVGGAVYFLLTWSGLLLVGFGDDALDLAARHTGLMTLLLLAATLIIPLTRFVPGQRTIIPDVALLMAPFVVLVGNVYLVGRYSSHVATVQTAGLTNAVQNSGLTNAVQNSGLTNPQQLAIGWCLCVVPLLCGLPFVRLQFLDAPRTGWIGRIRLDMVRAQLVLAGILERHLVTFAIALPATIALCMRVLAQDVTPDEDIDALAFLLAPALAWLAPFLYSLFFIEETFEGIYTTQLRRVVQRLRDHVMVLGYGDIGRRYVRELLQSSVVAYDTIYEDLAFSANIILPNGNVAKVFTRIAAIELEPSQIDGVVRPPGHSPLGHASLTPTVLNLTKVAGASTDALAPIEYVIPVVNGDASSEEVQNVAQIERAAFVTCVVRSAGADDRAQAVFQRLQALSTRGRYVPAALALRSSTYPPYLVEQIIRRKLPVHYILPTHLEGLNAANLIYALYRRTLDARQPAARVLICGRGKRLFYLIDSFIKAMSGERFRKFVADQNEQPFLIIMTTDDEFRKACRAAVPGDRSQAVPGDFPQWAEARSLITEWDLRVLTIPRHVSRNPLDDGLPVFRAADSPPPQASSPDGKNAPGTASFLPEPVPLIPLILQDSRDFGNVQHILARVRPQAVLVSDHEADDEFRSINAIGTSVSRLLNDGLLDTPPLLMVTGETGKEHLETNFQRAMAYYETIWRPAAGNNQPNAHTFPDGRMERASQASGKIVGDPLIDVLEDPVERLLGLTGAYIRRERHGVPTEMNFCLSDRPGTLARTLAGLSGYEAVGEQGVHASFTNSRFVANNKDRFSIRSFVELTDKVATQPAPAEGRSRTGIARVAVTSGYRDGEDENDYEHVLHGTIAKLVLSDAAAVADPVEESAAGTRATTRPAEAPPTEYAGVTSYVAAVRAQAAAVIPEPELRQEGDEIRRRLEQTPLPDSELTTLRAAYEREWAHCCGMPTCPVEAFNKTAVPIITNRKFPQRQRIDDVTRCFVPVELQAQAPETGGAFAYIKVDCSRLKAPGSFATALNALLRQRLHLTTPRPEDVFDFSYLSSYECHDERFGVFTCYGQRLRTAGEPEERRVALQAGQVIARVEIRPITQSTEWETYAKRLAVFLSDPPDRAGGRQFQADALDDNRGWEVRSAPTLHLAVQPGSKVQCATRNVTGQEALFLSHARGADSVAPHHEVVIVRDADGRRRMVAAPATTGGQTVALILEPDDSFVHEFDIAADMRRDSDFFRPGAFTVTVTYDVKIGARRPELIAACQSDPIAATTGFNSVAKFHGELWTGRVTTSLKCVVDDDGSLAVAPGVAAP